MVWIDELRVETNHKVKLETRSPGERGGDGASGPAPPRRSGETSTELSAEPEETTPKKAARPTSVETPSSPIPVTTSSTRMIIPKEDRRTIYENLFKDGVMVAKKDYDAPKHVELDVKNLYVIKACQSLNSRGLIKTQFSWKFYYYTLTDEGIEYLREWLNLPSEIVPATFKKVQRATPAGRPAQSSGAYRPPRGEGGGDREGYRKKESGADGGFRPRFAGIGRGAPAGDAPATGSW
ncbi:uncharacterized protein PGTG_13907 [Puccinia graminis f. sp. tritici CRL 75-36-700-3]|uniref:Small subunit ribosomal protein S10e n=2 Tax=Puccinia graminis f. sp. tritici TaxID=56615 RepID=E3KTB1_PUCGT|nr:uncharacterized protein PGTG_13907 [Puccinia graminis f. sp. tritici CRL 75-36-700-3]EFP87536.2 small subunit ribosomal protein S10e [Puccinia graminis f. sp. tritici CRL 75-36-700-3]